MPINGTLGSDSPPVTLREGESFNHTFNLTNPNPVAIELNAWRTNATLARLMRWHANESAPPDATVHETAGGLRWEGGQWVVEAGTGGILSRNSGVRLPPRSSTYFRLEVTGGTPGPAERAVVTFVTEHEQVVVGLATTVREGGVTFEPISFPPTFPGSSLRRPLRVSP